MRLRLAIVVFALISLGQTEALAALELLEGGSRDICGHPGCDEAGSVRVSRGVRARVIARRDPEYLGGRSRDWRLVIQTRDGVWATHEAIGEDATICTGEDHMTWRFGLRDLEARDVMDGPDPEVVVHFHDGRNAGAATWVMVCSVEASPPRCTAPFPILDPDLDAVFATRGRAAAIDERGAPTELPLVLR